MAKRSTKGIPDNLKKLAREGQRVRFNGFWLGDSERDRVIARWIDETPSAGAVIKHIVYTAITGQGSAVAVLPQDDYPEEIEIGEASSALLSFDD